MTAKRNVPSVSVNYNRTGKTAKANELGMRPMQESAYQQPGEQSSSSRRPLPARAAR